MKKFLTAAASAALALSLTACGGSSSNGGSTSSTSTTAPTTEGEEKYRIAYVIGNLGDKSFSDSGERGMETLRAEGYDVKTIETMKDAAKYDDYILDAIDQGYNMIVASSTYYDNMRKIADEYPDVKFICFDDNKEPEELPENMAVIFYAQNEGSYLVGYMAAAISETGTVAVDVGMTNPVICDFITGYVQGVKDYNEETGSSVKVVTAEVGSWSDPAKMKSLVLDQNRNNKADVFYQVAGGSGDGLFEACGETGSWAIGVDSDQYAAYKDSENPEKADVILTSMLKEVGNSLVAMVHSIEAGDDVWQKTTVLGLKEDSVGYVQNEYFEEKVPAEVREMMEKTADEIKAGNKEVKSYYDFASEAEYQAFINE